MPKCIGYAQNQGASDLAGREVDRTGFSNTDQAGAPESRYFANEKKSKISREKSRNTARILCFLVRPVVQQPSKRRRKRLKAHRPGVSDDFRGD
jgi:hypothetical protein